MFYFYVLLKLDSVESRRFNMPKPSQISAELRKIAAGIDEAQQPSPQLVAEALKSVLDTVQAEAPAAPAEAPAAPAPTPSQIAASLKKIASGIENSKKPDPAKVANAIKRVVQAL